jgi:vitamin B12 transporter
MTITAVPLSPPTPAGPPRAAGLRGLACAAGLAAIAIAAIPPATAAADAAELQTVVVTGKRAIGPGLRAAGTVQIIDAQAIRESTASSVTELLAERAVGFFSEWTPAQTSINLRGGASDGQGRDFRSQVLVLLNGRRAGTANLSKLSLDDLARIEIVRGPASVSFGSQAMGGVINLVTRSGADTAPGGALQASAGSWSATHAHGHLAGEVAGFDGYAGVGAARRDDYRAGRGSPQAMVNTAWRRWGALVALGRELGDDSRIDLTLRRDGVYDAGFRGSSWDHDNHDDRWNQSLDLAWAGRLPTLPAVDLQARVYALEDVDDFYWGSEVAGVDLDHNTRRLRALGLDTQARWRYAPGSEFALGLDLERSQLRSTRERVTLAGVRSVIAPLDHDQDEQVLGAWAEWMQRVGTLDLVAGVRQTIGRTTILPTPGGVGLVRNTVRYDQTTATFGFGWQATPQWRLRAHHGSGFRAPTANELAADFLLVLGGQVVGNPELRNETSRQTEVGATYTAGRVRADAALFDTRIRDRIATVVTGPAPGGQRSTFVNSPGDLVLRGVDVQLALPLLPAGSALDARMLASGTHHVEMVDEGAPPALNSRQAQRIHRNQASVGLRLAAPGAWDLTLTGLWRGSVWWDTEERLLIPVAEPRRDFVHRKSGFWTVNLRSQLKLAPNLRVFGAVDNLTDQNEHPLFIALERAPYLSDPAHSNGGRGNSLPGRSLRVGLKLDF